MSENVLVALMVVLVIQMSIAEELRINMYEMADVQQQEPITAALMIMNQVVAADAMMLQIRKCHPNSVMIIQALEHLMMACALMRLYAILLKYARMVLLVLIAHLVHVQGAVLLFRCNV
jgi:hypothetical protein